MSLIDQIVSLSRSLDTAKIERALGGALALAYATSEPRATRDIDVNVFVDSSQVDRVFDAMPQGVRHRRQIVARFFRTDRFDCSGTTLRSICSSQQTTSIETSQRGAEPFPSPTLRYASCAPKISLCSKPCSTGRRIGSISTR